jgi:monoamine oxidase
MTADLVIVGAGAAGAGAWHAARERGLSVRWIEAGSRTGGRAWTDHEALSMPFDLGCHWLHTPRENPFREFADRYAVPYVTNGLQFGFHDGARFLDADAALEGNAALERSHDAFAAALARGEGGSLADVLDRADAWYPYCSGWGCHEYAAELDLVSCLDRSSAVASAGDYPIPSGYGALLQRRIAGAPVELDCPARAIDLSRRDRVRVETPRGAIEAGAVLLTVSTHVLAREAIRLTPHGWPLEKLRAIEATPLGSSTKVAVALPLDALPRELHGAFVICRLDAPRNVAWHFAPHGFACAVAYLGGSFSRELALAGEVEQIAFATDHLGSLLGGRLRMAVTAAIATPFDRDPHIGGGYSYCRAESGDRRDALAAPLDGRVLFAGEACSARFPTTAHGAWLSGREAVRRFDQPAGGS